MDNNNKVSNFQLSSPVFEDGQPMPAIYTCRGENTSPPLNISGTPNSAKSLALIMHDPDAIPVAGIDFVHWLVWNIPIATKEIAQNVLPTSTIIGINSRGENKYTGPCPPAGTGIHHYIFELYALDTSLDLPSSTNREQLEAAMSKHILDNHVLTGLFTKDV